MADPTIISCAVTGNITTLQQTPHLPCTPEEIANASRSLASDESRYITGVTLPGDAGHCVK